MPSLGRASQYRGLLLLAAACGCLDAFAAGTKINGVVYSGRVGGAAQTPGKDGIKDPLPPDMSLRMKKVFLFPSIDDVSGALSPKLDEKLSALFGGNVRFELIRDPQVVRALSPDEASYYKAALSAEVHREAARVTGADTTALLRTRNVGTETRIVLEMRDAHGGLLLAEEGSVRGSSPMDARWELVEKLYGGMLSRLPFEGAVTGRTAGTITVDLGLGNVRQGEEIELARIVSVQKHPLLGTVVGVDYARTGRARVTAVDRVLSFAEVIDEMPGERVLPGQKVLRQSSSLIHRSSVMEPAEKWGQGAPHMRWGPARRAPGEGRGVGGDPMDDRLKGDFDRPVPRYGMVGAVIQYGSLSHSQSVSGVAADYSGGGLGGELTGELWVTKNWIFSAAFSAQSATLSGSGATVGSTSWKGLGVWGGYRIFPDSLAEGLVLTGSFGYHSMSFDIPTNSAASLGGKKYSGLELRADGEISFLERQKISVGFSLQPFASVTESGPSLGTPNSGTVIGLHLGWNRQLMDALWLRVGLRYEAANGSYDGSSSTISDKRFAIGPGIYYFF